MTRFQAHPARRDHDRRHLRRLASVAGIVVLTTAALVSAVPVLGHEITKVDVECGQHQLVVSWTKFGEGERTLTVTATDYLETFLVTTTDGTHAFPLPPNGPGEIDWEDSGDFGPVPFVVDCPEATPTPTPEPSVTPSPEPSSSVPAVTPTPRHPDKTPPPTDTEPVSADPALGPVSLLISGLFLLAAAGYLETSRRGRRLMDRLGEKVR